jgi:hypothetical protein
MTLAFVILEFSFVPIPLVQSQLTHLADAVEKLGFVRSWHRSRIGA